jgi:hypothetical protein
MDERRGRKMEELEQTNKYKHNKTAKTIWESIYAQKVLVVKEDYE